MRPLPFPHECLIRIDAFEREARTLRVRLSHCARPNLLSQVDEAQARLAQARERLQAIVDSEAAWSCDGYEQTRLAVEDATGAWQVLRALSKQVE